MSALAIEMDDALVSGLKRRDEDERFEFLPLHWLQSRLPEKVGIALCRNAFQIRNTLEWWF